MYCNYILNIHIPCYLLFYFMHDLFIFLIWYIIQIKGEHSIQYSILIPVVVHSVHTLTCTYLPVWIHTYCTTYIQYLYIILPYIYCMSVHTYIYIYIHTYIFVSIFDFDFIYHNSEPLICFYCITDEYFLAVYIIYIRSNIHMILNLNLESLLIDRFPLIILILMNLTSESVYNFHCYSQRTSRATHTRPRRVRINELSSTFTVFE